MTYYKNLSYELFVILSCLLSEDIKKHAELCRLYPEYMNEYVKKIEFDMEKMEPPFYLSEEERQRQFEIIWNRIKKTV